ncbi:MAG: carbon-nitrogen hydrolase family protein [Proteobacteria bacterium]|nr:carbon-nitrogen hydrolase family protein [Pseudomonadota bacterium]
MTSTADVDANVEALLRLAGKAGEQDAELILAPECFAYLGPEDGKLEIAEPLPEGGPILDRCASFARESRLQLILGGFWELGETAGKVRNACVHLGSDGAVKAIYRKIHLFDVTLPDGTVLMESETVVAGGEAVVTRAPFGTLGLSICYDLRFPELYRQLVSHGAIALAVPAAFTFATGTDHWHVLLRARAIESQAYVIAAAQVGHHYGPRRSYGHALICDPWGRIRAEQTADGEGFAIASIDPTVVTEVRASLPSLTHRRLR